MKKFFWAMAVVSVGTLVFVAGSRAQSIHEGKWSMTMVTIMEGMAEENTEAMNEMDNMSPEEKAMMQQMMGGMNIQMNGNSPGITTTVTKCLSDQDPVPDTNQDEDCQETHAIDGNTVNFESVCSNSKSTGQVTYDGEDRKSVV